MSNREYMLNLCNFELFRNQHDWQKIREQGYCGVYFGFDLCDKMISFVDTKKILSAIEDAVLFHLKIVYVLPPIHEIMIEVHIKFLTDLIHQNLLDELVVNDFGMLCYIRQELQYSGKISLGRLFDKTIREPRVDIYTMIESSPEIFAPSISIELKKIIEEFDVHSLETDTLPYGILDISGIEKNFESHVWYPRILVSKAAVCEFSFINNETRYFHKISNQCKAQCQYIGRKINATHPIYKEGLAVFSIQNELLEDAIIGSERVVISEELLRIRQKEYN